jgi:oxygen-dependent protoporphyrinogen oxidase
VPEREKEFQILGTLFSSTLFPNRAPEGHVLLTTFLGGRRHPHLVRLSDESLIRTAQQDLERLLGIRGRPSFTSVLRWEHAIPQYRKGYGVVKQTIERLEQEHHGLFMAGNFRSGVSVGDTAASAAAVSQRIVEELI